MSEVDKKLQKIRPIGSGRPDISTVDAAIISITKEISEIKREQNTQRSETKSIIIGVLIAFVAIVVTVAVEVILTQPDVPNFDDRFDFSEKLNKQQIELNTFENELKNLRLKNSYLK